MSAKHGFRRPASLEDFVAGADRPASIAPTSTPAQPQPSAPIQERQAVSSSAPTSPAAPAASPVAATPPPSQAVIPPAQAPTVPARTARTRGLPWDDARADVKKPINLQLTERHMLMLQFIARQTPYSMQSFCRDLLGPAIEQKVRELTKG